MDLDLLKQIIINNIFIFILLFILFKPLNTFFTNNIFIISVLIIFIFFKFKNEHKKKKKKKKKKK